MCRMTASAVACSLVLAVFLAGCGKNQPPATPELNGPTTGIPAKSVTYTFSTTDPEDQDVAYLVSWGDASAEDWDEGYASGEEVKRAHKFADSGVYCVKVKARDSKLAESEWSDSIMAAIAFWPPNQPQPPTGPVSCTTGVAVTFTTKTTHPLGDSVWFQFNWGDTTGDWGGPVASDSAYSEEHTFYSAGVFNVLAQAKDARDRLSPWSDPLAVTVTFVEAPAKPVVACEPLDQGAKLRLTWGKDTIADFYEIKTDDSVHTTTDTSYDVAKACATLEVRAAKGSRKSEAAVIPVAVVDTATIVLFGISDPDTAHHHAVGFDSAGTATTYSLASANYPKLDFFADNLTHLDTMFFVNAGKYGWNAKGNALKDAGTTMYDDAKLADTTGYEDENVLVVDRVYYLWLDRTNNGWSADDNFAKVKVLQVSGPLVTMRLGYQRVGGLRWLAN